MDITALLHQNIFSNFLFAFIIGTGIIQISPIQLNPWTWICKRIGQVVNKELIQKVDKLESDISSLRHNMGENVAINTRVRILEFNEQILHNVKHSKDAFNQVLEDIDSYEKYCETHEDFKNNRAVLAINNVKDVYNKCMREHDFL